MAFSSCGEQGLLSSCGVWASHCGDFILQSTGSRGCRLQYLWHVDLVAPQHVESYWTWDWTRVPCIGRRFLATGPPEKSPLTFLLNLICPHCQWITLLHHRIFLIIGWTQPTFPTSNYHQTYQIKACPYLVSSFLCGKFVPSAFQGQPLHLGCGSHLAASCSHWTSN